MEQYGWLTNLDFILGLLVKLVGLITLFAILYGLRTGYYAYYNAPLASQSSSGGGFFRSLNFMRKLLFGCACDRPPASNY